jgi:ATP-binding cassette subfamily B protein
MPHPPAPTPEKALGWRDRIKALRNIPDLLRMVWNTSPSLTSLSVLLRGIAALLPIVSLWVAKLILDRVVLAVTKQPVERSEIWQLLAIEVMLALASDALTRGVHLCDSLLGDRFGNHISLRMMTHAGKLDLVSFEDPVFYDKMERARRQTTSRLGMLADLATTGQQLLTLVTLSLSVVWFSPWFLLLLIVAVVPAFLGETRFAVLAYSLLYQWTPERRQLDYLRMLGASNASAKEVKIFGLQEYLTSRTRTLFEQFYESNRKLAVKKAVTGTLLNVLPTAGYYGSYAYILYGTLSGRLTIGDLTFLTAAFARSRGLIEQIFMQISRIAEQALFIEDLFAFFRTEPTIQSPANPLPAPRPIRSGWEFRNVSFAYPGAERLVLNSVDLRIEAGEKIALIGENGSGKTTLVKLLTRLYDPTAGTILLDGIDLREYNIEELRKEIGVIFQDFMRYDMRVLENIGFGNIDISGDEVRIREAARKSYAEDLVESLPQGYEQMLGRRFDGGMDLSGGQWQKIALARAYLRDAQLLILDEPTATLDARAEFEVFKRFTELTQDRMAVLISHRFSTVRMADRILVLDGGVIAEQGTHMELLARSGRYAELFELQAAGYR